MATKVVYSQQNFYFLKQLIVEFWIHALFCVITQRFDVLKFPREFYFSLEKSVFFHFALPVESMMGIFELAVICIFFMKVTHVFSHGAAI